MLNNGGGNSNKNCKSLKSMGITSFWKELLSLSVENKIRVKTMASN